MNKHQNTTFESIKNTISNYLRNYLRILSHMRHRKKQPGHIRSKYSLCLYFSVLFLYLETFFHIFMFHSIKSFFLYPLILSFALGILIGIICSLFKPIISYWTTFILTMVFSIFFCVEVIYHAVFQSFLAPFGMLNVGGQALDFTDTISRNVWSNILIVIVMLLPIVFFFFFIKNRLYYGKERWSHMLTYLGTAVGLHLLFLLFVSFGSHSLYSAYDLYYHNVSTDQSIQHFGVLTAVRLNGKYALFGAPASTLTTLASAEKEETQSTPAPTATPTPIINTEPNEMNIDFESIKESTDNESVQQLCDYFSVQTPTNKNEYTGLFEGYNLIFITAEGFTNWVIDPTLTPTLYKLQHEGFVFNNFYTPIWYASTSDGEYANLSGNLPTDGVVSFKVTGTNANNMYFTLGRQLERLNYTLNAYHANTYTYYGRDLTFPNMGYNWKATGNWYDPETDEDGYIYWPQSDLRLVDQSIGEYVDSQPFHTYYMSISGHMEYGFDSNYMAGRNEALVADLPYSDQTRAYIAANLELEKALTKIVDTLEEKGIADKTAIVLCADHVPYDYKEISDEIAGETLDELDWQRNALIIWSGSMKEPVTIDKYCYDVDILPTVSNLFGLEYDSRLLSGQDILSDSDQLVMFLDHSFITEKCIYNASTEEVTSLTGEEISQDYIDEMKAIVYDKFQVSTMVLNTDFYKYIDTGATTTSTSDTSATTASTSDTDATTSTSDTN